MYTQICIYYVHLQLISHVNNFTFIVSEVSGVIDTRGNTKICFMCVNRPSRVVYLYWMDGSLSNSVLFICDLFIVILFCLNFFKFQGLSDTTRTL